MKTSAGLLLYRPAAVGVEVLLAHMGGPFWAAKDAAAWSVPKGELESGENPLAAAVREFTEELGFPPPPGADAELGAARQGNGKTVLVWARAGDVDAGPVHGNTATIQWPPRSGKTIEVPEIDRVQWFSVDAARVRLVKGQVVFLDRLAELMWAGLPAAESG